MIQGVHQTRELSAEIATQKLRSYPLSEYKSQAIDLPQQQNVEPNTMPTNQIRSALRSAYYLLFRSGFQWRHHDSEVAERLASISRILMDMQGYGRSVSERSCVRPDGSPIPWITYPAIEYLSLLDFSKCSVFEYGSGNSTLFWSQRARSVVSVESNPTWHAKISAGAPQNCEIKLETDEGKYINAIGSEPERYDVVIVDGLARTETVRMAARAVTRTGMIVVDDVAFLPSSAEYLRDSGFIELIFSGFSPISQHASSTGVYLRRDFSIPRYDPKVCAWALGAPRNRWEGTPIVLDAPLP